MASTRRLVESTLGNNLLAGHGVSGVAVGGVLSTSGSESSSKTSGGLGGETVPTVADVLAVGFPCIVTKREQRARTSSPKLETSDFSEPMWRPTRSSTATATTVPISATAAAVVAWAAVVAESVDIVFATPASCLAVAASMVQTVRISH